MGLFGSALGTPHIGARGMALSCKVAFSPQLDVLCLRQRLAPLTRDVNSFFQCTAPIIAYGVCKKSFVVNYGLNSPVEGRDGISCRDIPTNNL